MFSASLIAVGLLQVFPSRALWIPEELQQDAAFWVAEDFTSFVKRQQSTCGDNANLNPCGSGFPSDFCCSSGTQCLLLNTTSSITAALCCPAGQDCAAIRPIQCDQAKQNATTVPASQLHSEPTTQLETCGSACCPMGYKCQGSVCLAQSKAEAASSSASSSSSSSILPTSTSTALSTTTASLDGTTITPVPLGGATQSPDSDHFSGKSFAAGFVPGIILGALIAAGLVLFVLRKKQRKSRSCIDEKHYSTGRDTLTDLGPEPSRRPTVHGRSISEPTVDMSMGHRTDFFHSSPPRDEEAGLYGLQGYTVHVQSPAKAPITPASQAQEAAPRSKGWLSRSPFVNQVQTPVPTQSPVPAHMKRGTLNFQISPVRALRKQRSMHSLRRQMTDATTRSNSARRNRPDLSRSGSTETIKVLMDTPDTSRRPAPRTLPSATSQPQAQPLPSASTWQTTSSSSDDSTPIEEQPSQDDYTPTRPGRNSTVANVGATLQSPYTPSNYPNPDQHERDRNRLTGLLPPEMAGNRDSAWRNTAMTTFSSMMEKAGWRKSFLGDGKGKEMKEKELVLGPDPRRWNR